MAAKGNGNVFVCEWEIENLCIRNDLYLECEFVAYNLFESNWSLCIDNQVFEEKTELSGCYFELQRRSDSNGIEEMVINWEVEMADAEGKILTSFSRVGDSFEQNSSADKRFMGFKELCDILSQEGNDTLRVVCTMEVCEPLNKNNVSTCNRCKAKTTVNKSDFKFDVEVSIPLPDEPVLSFNVKKANLQAKIFCQSREDAAVIEVRFERAESNIICYVHLLDWNGERKKSVREFKDWGTHPTITFPSFLSLRELQKNKEIYLNGDAFKLNFHFILPSVYPPTKSISYINSPPTYDSLECLRYELLCMFKASHHADVQLRTSDKVFPAHKSVLAARSPVFSAMFEHDMLESRTGSVDCTDLDSSTAEPFLEFLYSGKVQHTSVQSSLKLLLAADKYRVPSLVQECAHHLKSVLSTENVCDVVSAADMIGHAELKGASTDFIVRNADDILMTPRWLTLAKENVELGSEIMCKTYIYMKSLIPKK